MVWMTLGTAILATVMLGLVAIGLREHIFHKPRSATDFMGLGIFLVAVSKALRLLWWDLLPLIFWFRWSEFGIYSEHVNWLFNTGFAAGSWCILRAMHMLLPEERRGDYNLITVAFYPYEAWQCFKRRLK